jgi:hypothetical protein
LVLLAAQAVAVEQIEHLAQERQGKETTAVQVMRLLLVVVAAVQVLLVGLEQVLDCLAVQAVQDLTLQLLVQP